ncbi:MAG TPA: hypothetical protein VLT47_12160, partial [Anaeromyxobacteraceae bacterium]|nr:hypothetical protein [Anaeromyxobacteraceae bacterium]
MPQLSTDSPRWDAPGLQVAPRLARVPWWAALAAFAALAWLLAVAPRRLAVAPGSPAVVWPIAGLFL